MASPSKMIGWECGACTYTIDDCTRRDCQLCMTERPKRYFVMPGAGVSATARMTTVDRCEQARLAALRDDVQDAPPSSGRGAHCRGGPCGACAGGGLPPCPVVKLCSTVWWRYSSTLSARRRTTGAALVPATPAADCRWRRDPRWRFVASSWSFATS